MCFFFGEGEGGERGEGEGFFGRVGFLGREEGFGFFFGQSFVLVEGRRGVGGFEVFLYEKDEHT